MTKQKLGDGQVLTRLRKALHGSPREEVGGLRKLGLRGREVLGMLLVYAFQADDRAEMDRLLGAGVSFQQKMPPALLGGEIAADQAGNPRLLHVIAGLPKDASAETIRHLGDRAGDLNLTDGNGRTPLDWGLRGNRPADILAAWRDLGARAALEPDVQSTGDDSPSKKGVEEALPQGPAQLFLEDAPQDQVSALRRMDLDDEQMLTIFLADAIQRNDRPAMDRALAAGASLLDEVPPILIGGETRAKKAGHPRLIHMIAFIPEDVVPSAISYLYGRMGDVNLRDRNGRTALSYAAECGASDHVRVWLAAGALASVRDNKGVLPSGHAAAVGRNDNMLILRKAERTETWFAISQPLAVSA